MGPTKVFLASKTYEKQLRIEKTRLSHQVWSHGGSTFKKNMTLNGHFSRPAETDPYTNKITNKNINTNTYMYICIKMQIQIWIQIEYKYTTVCGGG